MHLIKDPTFAIVAHGPFFSDDAGTEPADMDLALVAFVQVNTGETDGAMWSDDMDIIIKTGTYVKYGCWSDLKTNLTLGLSKLAADPTCCVCDEEKLMNSSCAVCSEITCRTCLDQWAQASAGVTTCPMCRAEFARSW
jgi:hypothetical protein